MDGQTPRPRPQHRRKGAGPGDGPACAGLCWPGGRPAWNPDGPRPRGHGAWASMVTPCLVAVLPGRAEGVATGEDGDRVEVVGGGGVDHGDRVDTGAGADRGG